MMLKFMGFVVLFCKVSNGIPQKSYSPYTNGRNICHSQYGPGTCKSPENCDVYRKGQINFSDFLPCYADGVFCCPTKIDNFPPAKRAGNPVLTNTSTRTSIVAPTRQNKTITTSTTAPRKSIIEFGHNNMDEKICRTDTSRENCVKDAVCFSKIGAGQCVPLQDCEPLLNRSIPYANLSRCTFEGVVEIICCPTVGKPKIEREVPQIVQQTNKSCNTKWRTKSCVEGAACFSPSQRGVCQKAEHCSVNENRLATLETCSKTLYCCPLNTTSPLEKTAPSGQTTQVNGNENGWRAPQQPSSRPTKSAPISTEGRHCSFSTTNGGICKRLDQCSSFLSGALKSTNLGNCEANARDSDSRRIVCCPQEVSPTTESGKSVTKKRPAMRACEIYKAQNPKRMYTHRGGVRRIRVGEFPHIGFVIGSRLHYKPRLMCGVALVSQRFALTTANCARSLSLSDIIRFGSVETNLSEAVGERVDASIKNIWINDYNKPEEDYHDLALLEFEKDIALSRQVHPACLHVEEDDLPRKENLQVNGWSTMDPSQDYTSPVLYVSTVNTMQLPSCNFTHYRQLGISRRFIYGLDPGQYCTRNTNPKKCDGDVGFPLTRDIDGQFEIIGILSMEFGCSSNAPSIYSRIAYYIQWIEEIVWPNSS